MSNVGEMTKGDLSIDLHNTRHHEVERKVIRVLEDNWDCGKTLYIITGNSERMKEIVKTILYDYKLEFSEKDELNPLNNGIIKTKL